MILENLPYRLKNLRESAKLNQYQAAKLAGITQAQISNYEVGKQFPGLETATKLAKVYGVTVADLLEEKEPVTAPPRPPTKVEMALWVIEEIGIPPNKVEFIRGVIGKVIV